MFVSRLPPNKIREIYLQNFPSKHFKVVHAPRVLSPDLSKTNPPAKCGGKGDFEADL
jgi:hypothetical protein